MERLLKGAVAGAIGWKAMDAALRFLSHRQSAESHRREDRARGGIPTMEVMAERLAGAAGLTLSDEERQPGGALMQWMMGIGGGVLYAALRDHVPGSGLRRGIVYGAGFSLAVDEGLAPLLGFAPGPLAFPWQTHARGFAGHLVYGAVVETAMGWLEPEKTLK